MGIPQHWHRISGAIGHEEWVADLDGRLQRREQPSSFFEEQLLSDDYGPAVASWLEWAAARGGTERFCEVLRDPRHRRAAPGSGEQYAWRQALDELQVGYLLDQETGLAVESTCEPEGRDGTMLDWAAASGAGAAAFFEVRSLFGTRRPARPAGRRADSSKSLHKAFTHASEKFRECEHNAAVFVTHEPLPHTEEILHSLYGPDMAYLTAEEGGRAVVGATGIDARPRWEARGCGRMYAHFNRHEHTRVGALVHAHSRPDGTARVVVFHNPWAERALPPGWLDPWAQVSAVVADGAIRFMLRGNWPPDVRVPNVLRSAPPQP